MQRKDNINNLKYVLFSVKCAVIVVEFTGGAI